MQLNNTVSFFQLLHIVAGTAASNQSAATTPLQTIYCDSRCSGCDIFIALVGDKYDAHDFLADVVAQVLIVSDKSYQPLPNQAVIYVADTFQALAALARYNRESFRGTVIAITGSTGKTTLKAMIATTFAKQRTVHATTENDNNPFGVCYTLLSIPAHTDIVVIELGARYQGDIAQSAALAMPHYSIITNINFSHIATFGTIAAIAATKGELISYTKKTVFLNAADGAFFASWRQLSLNKVALECYGVATDNSHNLPLSCVIKDVNHSSATFIIANHLYMIPLPTRSSVLQYAIAPLLLISEKCGLNIQQIISDIRNFVPPSGRQRVHELASGERIIDDSYNANPASMRAALATLASSEHQHKIAILGDMAELGEQRQFWHASIGVFAYECGVQLICYGEQMMDAVIAYNYKHGDTPAVHCRLIDEAFELVQQLLQQYPAQCEVLVKGSRDMKMEKIVKKLLQLGVQKQCY